MEFDTEVTVVHLILVIGKILASGACSPSAPDLIKDEIFFRLEILFILAAGLAVFRLIEEEKLKTEGIYFQGKC